LLAGCLYGFAGGTLPNVKTVAILPFDNDTPEPRLTAEVSDAVRQALEGRLGLRVATEARADAIVRGRVVRYDPDVPQGVQTGLGQVTVTKRKVQIVVDVEIVNQREGHTVWTVITIPRRRGKDASWRWRNWFSRSSTGHSRNGEGPRLAARRQLQRLSAVAAHLRRRAVLRRERRRGLFPLLSAAR
jgi:hypothetical protein